MQGTCGRAQTDANNKRSKSKGGKRERSVARRKQATQSQMRLCTLDSVRQKRTFQLAVLDLKVGGLEKKTGWGLG